MTAVTLNGAAVTHQDSNKTGAASGAALSSYYISASNRNEQSVELAITAEKGYYVSRIVVACIDPHGQSPYSCKTWSAGNAYDVPFSLARSVKQNDGTFKLSIPLNSKNFCHSSNGSNHGYYILIQVAPIPKPVYVEYDYGNVLTLCGNNAKLAEALNNSAWWTTEGSDNAYGIGAGKFVANTKFEYNYSAVSDIQNWKHTTNSISLTAMAAVTPKNVEFLGWEVTYYAKCTRNGNELTFSEQVGTSSNIGEGQSLNVYTHAKLVAKWEIDTTPTPTPESGKATLVIRKEISGLESGVTVPADYFIKVKIDGVEHVLNANNMIPDGYIVEVEAGKPHTVVETASGSIPGYDHRRTGYSGLDANGTITIAEGKTGRVSIENKYVKHGTVIKPGKLTIKKTVEGVDVPDNYEVTVNVYNSDKSVNENIKLNKANSFSHTLELEEDRYYIKETTFTDINGYQLTGMDTQEHRPYDEGTGINKIFKMHVSDNSKADITIVNKYERVPEKAKLTVTKAVEGLEDGVELPNDYEVTVTVGNQTITLKKGELSKTIQLDAGTYTVTETDKSNIDGYDFVKTEYSNLDANNGITLAEGGEATVTVTNTYSKKQEPKANLTIKKTVEGVDIPEGYEVTVAVNGTEHKLNKDNQFSLNIEVAPGKYTIEEKGCTEINGYNCEATTITINGQTTQEIELENMTEGHVEITNKYAEEQKPQNGKLTITKSFRGVYAYDLPRSFTVYVRPLNEDGMTLGSAMAVVLNRNSDNTYSATIEVGYNVYEVTEQNPNLSGYVFTGANYSAVSTGRAVAGYDLPRTNGIYVSTGENGTASVAVTNSYYYDYHDYVPVIPPAKPLPPQTGDSGTAYTGIALCVMAAAAFVAARSRKRS
ncbi:MAG: DUF5979 domain-containing protein [Eubacteriales bacterium]|nr:DUF5979 domain-containing protein [Christensenellaceae bacterium]MDY2747816.1 DUF5979 domain-containing protein [Eubacteriales bacterium]